MATIALPIRELELSVRVRTDKARAEAECVVFYRDARAMSPSIGMTLKYGLNASILRFLLWGLAHNQKLLIRAYQRIDFAQCNNDELLKCAESLEKIAELGWCTLAKIEPLGPRAQRLIGPSVTQIAEQLHHFDSIAASLRSAADPETSLLLGLAVQQMAAD